MDSEGYEILNTFEVAKFLGRSPGAVRNLVMRRTIPYRKLAGRLIFLKHEIEQWVDGSPGIKVADLERE